MPVATADIPDWASAMQKYSGSIVSFNTKANTFVLSNTGVSFEAFTIVGLTDLTVDTTTAFLSSRVIFRLLSSSESFDMSSVH